ncbi:MAG: glycosyltransferase [Nitrososphaerota archaeon]|nr:glycosyltransferase [Candidatus Bathyarchaeota archaeon]MDW8194171.1 glycosyltransferase [Nitrososphaerota archaeon]
MKKSDETLPKISIIIATLNNERTIGECLRSLFEQDYPTDKMEIIIVDGGSEDDTLKIAKKYPAKIMIKPFNVPEAYNHIIKSLDSEVIGLVDADAKVEKSWLRKLLQHLENPNVAGASGTIETWNDESILPRCIGYDLKYRYSRIKRYANRIATMNLLLKRRIIEEVGGFNEKLPTQYDTEFGVRVTSRGYTFVLDSEVKCYHFNRPTWKEYFKQQLRYGKNTLRLYIERPELIRGDAITDFWMNMQPVLILLTVLLTVLGFIYSIMWYVSASILFILIILYITTAAKLAWLYKDKSALFLVAVYLVRAVAWTSGAFIAVLDMLKFRRKKVN